MGAPTSSPPSVDTGDLATVVAALDGERSPAGEPTQGSGRDSRSRRVRRTSTHRALVLTALGGLLIAGVIVVLGFHVGDTIRTANITHTHAGYSPGSRANVVFGSARSGNCLTWPINSPDQPSFVECKDDHLFEVAQSVDMRNFQDPCQLAVQRYLGTHYDPNSKFTISVLWSGEGAGKSSGDRHLLCGLQLTGADNKPIPFKGQVADLDQSKVWPAGTCLGIEPTTNQPNDIPVDCSAPHAVEVTGAVNLAEKFADGPPAEPDQNKFIRDACTRMTDAYLSPLTLQSAGLTLNYNTVSPASWLAGSRQVSCDIGAPLGNRGWATLTGSARGQLMINGQATPAALNLPATPSNPPDATSSPSPTPTATASPTPTATASPTPSTAPSPTTTPPLPTTTLPAPPPMAPSAQTPSTSPAQSPPAIAGATPEATPNPDGPPVIQIPGLDPITLPMLAPPAPQSPGA
jgi:hypothetical protein